jgi:hypothetical protein
MNIISIDHFEDRTTGKAKAWVTVEENGKQYTVGPHIAKPQAAKPATKRGGRPASAPMNEEAIIAAAVKAAVAAVKATK